MNGNRKIEEQDETEMPRVIGGDDDFDDWDQELSEDEIDGRILEVFGPKLRITDQPWSPLLYDNPPPTLFHYTNAAALLGILSSETIWASHQEYLNDDHEVKYVESLILQSVESFRSSAKEVNSRAIEALNIEIGKKASRIAADEFCVASFSETGDLLSQWERYAGPHGYSIGFNVDRLIDAGQCPLARVVYDEKVQLEIFSSLMQQAFELFLNEPTEEPENYDETWAKDLLSAMYVVGLSFKHSSFAEEKEWRCMKLIQKFDAMELRFRPGKFGIVPYLPIPLETNDGDDAISEIIIGSTHYFEESARALKMALERYRIDVPLSAIRRSSVTLRV